MVDYAKFKVGDPIYERETGVCLGTVTKLYRYWGDQRDPRYDTSMSIEYQFNTGGNFHDNTSRRGTMTDWVFCTAAEAVEAAQARVERLKYESSPEGIESARQMKEWLNSPEFTKAFERSYFRQSNAQRPSPTPDTP